MKLGLAICYTILPLAIAYLAMRRRAVRADVIIVLFGLTILGSGLMHLMDLVNSWKSVYTLRPILKIITATSALATVCMLIRVAPQVNSLLNTKSFQKIINELNSEITVLRQQDQGKELLSQKSLLAEKALKQSEDRFHAIADNIPNHAWIADSNKNVSWFNERWYEYTGLDDVDAGTYGLQTVIGHEGLVTFTSKWTAAITKGESFETVLSIKGSDNQFRPFLTRVVPLRNEKGEIINWLGTNTDISDRVKAEDLLKDQNAELLELRELAIGEMQNKTQILNGLLDYAPVIIYKIDNEGTIIDAFGSGIKSITDRPDLKGKKAKDISLNISMDEVNDLAENRASYISEGEFKGKPWYFENYFFPDRVSNDGVIGIGMDITGQKEISKQLSFEKERAENANSSKTRFLANMSHEIRTPLNAIIGFAQVLSKQNVEPERQREYLSHINSSGGILLRLIGDILDLSKIEEGKLLLQEGPFCFKECISNALLPYKYKANEKGLYFSLHFDEFIPKYLIGDEHRIKQVIINLVGNALKFTEKGGIIIFVSQRPANSADYVLIDIALSDTGIGVIDENKEAIFESFTQADSTIARRFGGSGLGLTIVKQLVDKMGGKIWVEDNRDAPSGSTFFMSIPLKKDCLEAEPMLQVNLPREGRLNFDIPLNILVAEDNPINQDLVGIVLKNLGASFDFASNGLEAVEMFKKEKYDLVLMDVQMPVMSGLEATKNIRQIDFCIPIIALTANVYKEDIDNCKSAGMSDHLPKPFTESQIFETVEKWVMKGSKVLS